MQSDKSRPTLSVVVLCYKAGDFINHYIPTLQQALHDNAIDYELVLVANYNARERDTDTTPSIARELALHNPAIQSVALEKRGMMGWDMKSGLAATCGEIIAVIDGDGQMPPDDVIRVYKKLQEEHLDVAQTFRAVRKDGLYRITISSIYNWVFRLLFPGTAVRDVNSKPKIFRRSAYEKLHLTSDGWFIDAEIIIQASINHLAIGEVPTTFYKNPTRNSFVTIGTIMDFAWNLLVYRCKKYGNK